MVVRTYSRRNRGSPRPSSDYLNDSVNDPFSESLSQESPRDLPFSIALSSQDSSSHWSTFNSEPNTLNLSLSSSSKQSARLSLNDSRNRVVRKTKKARGGKRKVELPTSHRPSFLATSTLMMAQKFREMMEHVDEVNLALDGLRKAQPARIVRASLLSLLSICGTGQQRRLLRTQGMAKTIIDAILSLNFDDSSSILAAATLFFVLTSDSQGLDDHILESPSSIRFLIELLKPVFSVAVEGKVPKIGTKLLAVCKDTDFLQNSIKRVDSSSTAIISKVQDILVSCKEMKQCIGGTSGIDRPELCPKWISLLTMEKACLSTVSIAGYSKIAGSARKAGGNFKEKLRELGRLDAIFEVAKNCYSDFEGKHTSISTLHERYESGMHILVLLLKCLKIMENAAILSKDNQSHLLGMKGSIDPREIPKSLPEFVICVIKILSDLYLLKSFSTGLNDGKYVHLSDTTSNTSELNQIQDSQVDYNALPSKNSSEHCCSMERFSKSSIKHQKRQFSAACLENYTSTSTYMVDGTSLKMRLNSFKLSSSNDASRRSNGGASKTRWRKNFGQRKSAIMDHDKVDPFAFDNYDTPCKWDVLSGKPKVIQPRKTSVKFREIENGCQSQLITSQEDLVNGDSNHSRQTPSSDASYNEYCSLLFDCLLTAVKVLMNLTTDNLVGCRQIASCGGLETMCSLIATHFPSYITTSSTLENGSNIELDHDDDKHLRDQELDFVVTILGLLVNLVEKDDQNRLRLAATCVPLPYELGVEESHRDAISLICSIFMANRRSGAGVEEGKALTWNDEAAVLQGKKKADKMMVEAYAALLLAFLSTASKSVRHAIAKHLPEQNLTSLVPISDLFVTFLLFFNVISPETHKAVSEVIESCRIL